MPEPCVLAPTFCPGAAVLEGGCAILTYWHIYLLCDLEQFGAGQNTANVGNGFRYYGK